MMFGKVMDRFVEQSAVSVMFRGTLENAVTPELLNEIFVKTAKRQRQGELLFSSVVDLLSLVATGSRKSVNDAYKARKQQFSVSVTAVYDKLNGVETEVSRQMVRQTAMRLAEVVKRLAPRRTPLLRGWRVKIIDGNHLAATEHRIEELRTIGSGPLPGQALVVLEPDRMLLTDVFPCEDGHHQTEETDPQRRDGNPLADEPARKGRQRPHHRGPVSPPLDGGECFSRVGPGTQRRDQDLGLSGYHGMMIAVPPRQWTRHFASLSPAALARILKALAAKVRPGRFRKNVRGPKKPRPKRTSGKRHPHVSTARILAKRKQPKTHAVLA
jgi:hypothetical protein